MATELFEWRPPKPRDPAEPWSEAVVFDSALSVYRAFVNHSYAVVARPDHSNRNTPEVDVIAEAPGFPRLVMEHTRLETFAHQLMTEMQVSRLLNPFQAELAAQLPNGLVCVIPTYAFVPGFDWKAVRSRIGAFLLESLPTLRPGAVVHEPPGVPFPVLVKYEPDLQVPFRFGHEAPPKEKISRDILASTEKALRHKKLRLQEYVAAGDRTVLLGIGGHAADQLGRAVQSVSRRGMHRGKRSRHRRSLLVDGRPTSYLLVRV